MLDTLTIPKPCDESWEDMEGDDRRRRCHRCSHDVVDLSTLSRAEAERALDGAPCVQVRFARPGWLSFRDGVVATVLAAGLAGCLRGKPPPEPAFVEASRPAPELGFRHDQPTAAGGFHAVQPLVPPVGSYRPVGD